MNAVRSATEIAGTRIVWHSGDLPDFHSYLAVAPARGLGVAILHNANSGLSSNVIHGVDENALRRMLALPPRGGDPPSNRPPLWIFGLVAVIAWQAVGLARLTRRPGRPARSPSARTMTARAVLSVAVVAVLLLGVPALTATPLPVILLYVPDLGLLLVTSAGVAAVQAVLQIRLARRALR